MRKATHRRGDENFAGLPIGRQVAMPLLAISEAQTKMSENQFAFVMRTCFHCGEDGNYMARTIKMVVSRPIVNTDEDGETQKRERINSVMEVPIISILPFNTLGIEKATVDFSLEVTSQFQTTEEEIDPTVNRRRKIARVNAKISGEPNAPHVNRDGDIGTEMVKQRGTYGHLDVNLVAGRLPLSKGLLNLIDVYNKAVVPVSIAKNSPGT